MKRIFTRKVQQYAGTAISPVWRSKGRLSSLAILAAIALIGAWTAAATNPSPENQHKSSAQTVNAAVAPDPSPQNSTPPPPDSSPPATNTPPQNTNVSINGNADGSTTVTVNGDTQSVPPNQSYDRTYSSSDASGNSSVTVHTSTTTESSSSASSSQQLNISLHSSSVSNAGGKEVSP